MATAFTVRLDETTLAELDQLAKRTERSRSWLVTQAVQDYVALNAWQMEKIEAGIAAADQGDFASDNEMTRLRAKFSSQK